MDYHQNARLTVHSREQLPKKVLAKGCTLKLAAASFNISAKTAATWVRRYRVHGDRTREMRGTGYEYLHIAIDDHSRISFAAKPKPGTKTAPPPYPLFLFFAS